MDRRERMKKLLDDLGGREAVINRLGRSDSTMKDWMARRAFAPWSYGAFAALGRERGVEIPLDLFGLSATDHWQPLDGQSPHEAA